MIFNTFSHVPGISPKVEQTIWKQDILNWDEFLEKKHTLTLPDHTKEHICQHILDSKKALESKNVSFFNTLSPTDQWRLFPHAKTCFLDIETTGLDKFRNRITTIGIFDGETSKILVNGIDLHTFPEEIKKYDLLVTFNGKCFDVPFLKAHFPEAPLDMPHLDLRYLMRQIGFSGGLKRIEKDVGLAREDDLEGVDGYEAVRLWKKYEKGDVAALEKLKKYNQADIENLKVLMELTYQKLRDRHFLSNCM
ncbi:MAG: ribonuclease H-like domain-containing protein [Candidatus Woesearchaeota archaeon]